MTFKKPQIRLANLGRRELLHAGEYLFMSKHEYVYSSTDLPDMQGVEGVPAGLWSPRAELVLELARHIYKRPTGALLDEGKTRAGMAGRLTTGCLFPLWGFLARSRTCRDRLDLND